MKRLLIAYLVLLAVSMALADRFPPGALVSSKRAAAGGGGSPAWSETIPVASTTDDLNIGDATFVHCSAVVASQSGNVTKLRVRIVNADLNPPFKLGLYDASSNLLAQASGTLNDSLVPYDAELTISSVSVTSGATYLIAFGSNAGALDVTLRRGNTSGKDYYDVVSYGSQMLSTYSEDFSGSGAVAAGMYIEP